MPAASQLGRESELEPGVVISAIGGGRHARRMFIVMYQDRVFRLLRRMLAPAGFGPDVVEDVAQETFVRALAALPSFDPDGPARVSTWVLTIATRLAIDLSRRERGRTRGAVDPDELPRSGGVEDGLLASALVEALATLPPDQRAAFVLREYDGMDYDEIARVLGVRPGTVASRLTRARQALQAKLKGEQP